MQEMQNLSPSEKEAILLGEEYEPLEAPEAVASLPECLEVPEPMEPTNWINDQITCAPSSPTPYPATALPGKQRNSSTGLKLT